MKKQRQAWLLLSAFLEILRYDAVVQSRGTGPILSQLKRQSTVAKPTTQELEQLICDAVLLATCFYWKPVLCLQRAACTVRLLRRHGIVARLVIGYRRFPFFSHAWVEVDGRVAYGSSAYQKLLTRLHVA
jgi:Transglutaminase-like superfamily